MLALALILLALVVVMVIASFTGGTDQVIIEFANVTITTSVGGVFVTGVLAGVVALLSLVALKISIQRIRHRNREVRELRRRAEQAAPPAAEPSRGEAATRTEDEPGQAELTTAGASRPAPAPDRPSREPATDDPTRPAEAPRPTERDTTRDDERP
jgi:uncharacterized membrane protein